MGDLTKNLSRHEFTCECGCGFDTVDVEYVDLLQSCADYFADKYDTLIRVKITGPNRCVKHNTAIGGASNSQHIYARAADFKLFDRHTNKQINPDEVAEYLEIKYMGKFGVGRYNGRTHFDNRTGRSARWDAR